MFDDTDDTDLLVRKRIVKLWTNFAKYLNPTPERTDLLQNITWPTFSATDIPYLNFNASLEIQRGYKKDIYRTWNETYYTYGAKPFITF